MEVKDVKESEGTKEVAQQNQPSKQRNIQALTSSHVPLDTMERVELSSESNHKTKENNEARSRANAIINVINIAQETAQEIGRLMQSIDGIAKQAEKSDFPQRLPVLESEANQLVEEIKRKADTEASGVRPLAGEEIKLEIDPQRPLKVIFSPRAVDAFGLGEIRLDPPNRIHNVKSAIKGAMQEIDALNDAIADAQNKVEEVVTAIEVAMQNSEAALASIRDVDEALNLASKTGGLISKSPDDAMNSAGGLDGTALSLLRS